MISVLFATNFFRYFSPCSFFCICGGCIYLIKTFCQFNWLLNRYHFQTFQFDDVLRLYVKPGFLQTMWCAENNHDEILIILSFQTKDLFVRQEFKILHFCTFSDWYKGVGNAAPAMSLMVTKSVLFAKLVYHLDKTWYPANACMNPLLF